MKKVDSAGQKPPLDLNWCDATGQSFVELQKELREQYPTLESHIDAGVNLLNANLEEFGVDAMDRVIACDILIRAAQGAVLQCWTDYGQPPPRKPAARNPNADRAPKLGPRTRRK